MVNSENLINKPTGLDYVTEYFAMVNSENLINKPTGLDYVRAMEQINDDLAIVARLLNKPPVCMAAPEIMDVIRMALDLLVSRFERVAVQLRREAGGHG